MDFLILVKHRNIPVQGLPREKFGARSSSEIAVRGLTGQKPILEMEFCEQNQRVSRYLFERKI